MTEREFTWHYRLWLLAIVLAIFTILLSDRFHLGAKLDKITKDCSAYTIDLKELEPQIEDIKINQKGN